MIYIIRHGETRKNKEKLLQGRSNDPLNEAGIRQAEEAREFFKDRGIHKCLNDLKKALARDKEGTMYCLKT